MKKILLAGLTALNIITAGTAISQQPQVVEKIVEVEKLVEVPAKPTQVTSSEKEIEKIIATYEKCVDGKTIVEFSDYSWAIINHEKEEYVFQPACMGDWDMTFESYEDLKNAMATYFNDKEVVVEEPEKIIQTEENELLNPDKFAVVERELNKVPTGIKKLLVDNGVEILIEDGILDIEEGKQTYGLYYWDSNQIVLDAHNYSVEDALIHEIGHALDDLIDMRTEKIMESYENKEIKYDNDHFYSAIEEYIAQGVHEYFNGTLDKDTDMYKELEKILGEYE